MSLLRACGMQDVSLVSGSVLGSERNPASNHHNNQNRQIINIGSVEHMGLVFGEFLLSV